MELVNLNADPVIIDPITLINITSPKHNHDIKKQKELKDHKGQFYKEFIPPYSDKKIKICPSIPDKELSQEEKMNIRKMVTTKFLFGLSNLGNTCFLNSVLQAIIADDTLRSVLLDENEYNENLQYIEKNIKKEVFYNLQRKKAKKHNIDPKGVKILKRNFEAKLKDKLKEPTMLELLRELVITADEGNRIIGPEKIKKKISNLRKQFYGYGQQDAEEAFTLLISNGLADETKRSANVVLENPTREMVRLMTEESKYKDISSDEFKDPIERLNATNALTYLRHNNYELYIKLDAFRYWHDHINENFSIVNPYNGLSCSILECNECEYKSASFDNFYFVPLVIPQKTGEVTLDDCFKQYSAKEELEKDNYWYCPRCEKKVPSAKSMGLWEAPDNLVITFKRFNYHTNGGRGSKIDTTVHFPFNDMIINNLFSDSAEKKEYKYELYATVNHSGNLGGGHYIAYTKSSMNGLWYKRDDSNTSAVKFDSEKDLFDKISGSCFKPYLLFYRRIFDDVDEVDESDDEIDL